MPVVESNTQDTGKNTGKLDGAPNLDTTLHSNKPKVGTVDTSRSSRRKGVKAQKDAIDPLEKNVRRFDTNKEPMQ